MGASALRFQHRKRGKGKLRLGFHGWSAIADEHSRSLSLYSDYRKSILPSPQAPMSRVEPDTFINDRYAAIEDRLQVCALLLKAASFIRKRHVQISEIVNCDCRSYGSG